MVSVGVPLRHPFNFQVYVTPGATASDESVEDNMQALYKRIQEFSSAEKRCWSFAVYFLPTSSLEEIISHYQAERAHRHASSWPIPHSYRNTLMNYNAFVLIVDDDIALFQADKQLENYPEVSTFSFEHQIPEWAKDDAEYEEPEQCVGRESVDSVGEWLDALCDNIWGQDRDMEFQDEVRKHLQEQGVDL